MATKFLTFPSSTVSWKAVSETIGFIITKPRPQNEDSEVRNRFICGKWADFGVCSPVLTTMKLVGLLLHIFSVKATLQAMSAAQSPLDIPLAASTDPFWLEAIKHQGKAAYNQDPSYQVFRNVKDFGAKGDGLLFPILISTHHDHGLRYNRRYRRHQVAMTSLFCYQGPYRPSVL